VIPEVPVHISRVHLAVIRPNPTLEELECGITSI
jgi:hypothetical protein